MNQTISENYLKLQKKLHKNPSYGVVSIKFAPNVKKIVEDHGGIIRIKKNKNMAGTTSLIILDLH